MATNPVILILGARPRIGASVTEECTSNGYKVASAPRSGSNTKTAKGFLSLKADLYKPDSIPALFDEENNMPWHATFLKDKGYVQFK